MKMKSFIVFFICLFTFENLNSQLKYDKELSIGDRLPSEIWKKIPKQAGTKLVILDFWSTWCGSCIESFPEMGRLQKKFGNQLQIVLINSWETKSEIYKRLSSNKSKYANSFFSLRLPMLHLNNGSAVFKSIFKISSIPHHIWINADGVIQTSTYGYNATEEHIQAMLDGNKINMILKDDKIDNSGLLAGGILNSPSKLLPPVYYSGFMRYFNTAKGTTLNVDSLKSIFKITQYNNGVIALYRTAFKNSGPLRYILDLKDPAKYFEPQDPNLLDEWKRNYAFTYELQASLKERESWQQIMRIDVNRFFGTIFGIEGNIEKRKYKSLVLIKSKAGLLTTTRGAEDYTIKDNYFRIINYSFGVSVQMLKSALEDMKKNRPFLNETGIDDNLKVDMQLTGDFKNIENIRKQLYNYGLEIIEIEREIEVLVIKDKQIPQK